VKGDLEKLKEFRDVTEKNVKKVTGTPGPSAPDESSSGLKDSEGLSPEVLDQINAQIDELKQSVSAKPDESRVKSLEDQLVLLSNRLTPLDSEQPPLVSLESEITSSPSESQPLHEKMDSLHKDVYVFQIFCNESAIHVQRKNLTDKIESLLSSKTEDESRVEDLLRQIVLNITATKTLEHEHSREDRESQ